MSRGASRCVLLEGVANGGHDVFDGRFDGGTLDEVTDGALVLQFGGLGGVAFFDRAGGLVTDAVVGVGVRGGVGWGEWAGRGLGWYGWHGLGGGGLQAFASGGVAVGDVVAVGVAGGGDSGDGGVDVDEAVVGEARRPACLRPQAKIGKIPVKTA